jgi:PAS domain S-box-containing protein
LDEELPFSRVKRTKQPVRNVKEVIEWEDGRKITLSVNGTPLMSDTGEFLGMVAALEDISERKRAEEKLLNSEKQLRAVLNAAPSPVAVVDVADDKIEFWSDSALTLFGHTASTAREWYSLAYPDPDYRENVLARWKPAVEKARSSGGPVNAGEYRVTCRDGSVRICELFPYFVEDKLIVSFKDVTDMKAAAESMAAERNRARQCLELAGVMLLFLKKDKTISFINRKGCDVLGYTYEELLGRNWFELAIPAELRGAVEGVFSKIVSGKMDVVEQYENAVLTRGGIQRIVNWHNALMFNLDGTIEGVLCSGEDITERKAVENSMRDSEEKYQKIFQSAPLLVALSGIADGRYVDCNKQFFHVLGFKREEVIGRTSIELGIFTPEVRSTLLSNRNNIQGLELTVRTKDGRLITCAFYAEIVKVAGVDRLLSMAIDVTERNSAAERMRVLHADLMEKNKDMESFLYLTTHDLRTPLVNMLGYSKQLGSDIKNLQAALSCAALPKEIKGKVLGLVDESITKSLMFISESAIKMDLMINGLLKMARLGRMEITAVRLDMNVLLQKVHAALSYQLEKAGCAFKVEALPPCISDPSVMIHVFTNLINNAVKYRHRGRKLEITVRGEIKDGKTAIYTVSDNGQGIKASDLDKIGQMFFRGYLQDPAIEQGEGIGIAMVKRMLARTGGTLAVRSTEGVGTQIYVELPSEKAG